MGDKMGFLRRPIGRGPEQQSPSTNFWVLLERKERDQFQTGASNPSSTRHPKRAMVSKVVIKRSWRISGDAQSRSRALLRSSPKATGAVSALKPNLEAN